MDFVTHTVSAWVNGRKTVAPVVTICREIGFRLRSDRNVTNPKPITVYGILASIFQRMKMTLALERETPVNSPRGYRMMTPSMSDSNPLSDTRYRPRIGIKCRAKY